MTTEMWAGPLTSERDFHEYDVASRTWKGWTDLYTLDRHGPLKRALTRGPYMGFALLSNKLFVSGGSSLERSFDHDIVLYEYDIVSDKWKDLSSQNAGTAPPNRLDFGFAGSNGKLFVFGGYLDRDDDSYSSYQRSIEKLILLSQICCTHIAST